MHAFSIPRGKDKEEASITGDARLAMKEVVLAAFHEDMYQKLTIAEGSAYDTAADQDPERDTPIVREYQERRSQQIADHLRRASNSLNQAAAALTQTAAPGRRPKPVSGGS